MRKKKQFGNCFIYPKRRDFEMQSAQNLCKHSIIVRVSRIIPKQTGQVKSMFKSLISKVTNSSSSILGSGFRCSS